MTHARRSLLLATLSLSALSACSGGERTSNTPAPMPPISEMDAAMSAPAPEPLAQGSATLIPVSAEPAPLAPPGASVEERVAALEQSVGLLRADYARMAPAFASLNTTNERIDALLTRMEGEGASGMPPVAVSAPSAMTPTYTPPPVPTAVAAPSRDILPAGATAKVITPANAPDISGARITTSAASGQTPVTRTISQSRLDTPPPAPSITPLASPALSTKTTTTTTVKPVTEAMPAATVSGATNKASNPAVAAGTTSVSRLRIGEHGTKTRLVFDLTSKEKPAFKTDLDNGEKLLVIEMPSSIWNGAVSGKPNSPLVSDWSALNAPAGATVAIQLKKPARILSTEYLKAEGKDPARMVVDIAPE